MSSFTDSMLDDGFEDPSDYLDYLSAKSYLRDKEDEDFIIWDSFDREPRYIRRLTEPACPNCGNELIVLGDDTVRCKGFPGCYFSKEISSSVFYLESVTTSFALLKREWSILRSEINHFDECPNCKNKLKKIKYNSRIYHKCSGYPVCRFMINLEQ